MDVLKSYCSWCFNETKHQLNETNLLTKNEYICNSCENNTVKCTYCENMAKGPLTAAQVVNLEKLARKNGRSSIKKWGDNWKNECCAQHDGTISSFDDLHKQIPEISDYCELIEPKYTNVHKFGWYATGTLTTAGIVALTVTTGGAGAGAAAALGQMGLLGAAGTGTAISTLSGAALTSASLAAIGGSVAAGTAIIAAVGTGLGGVAGAVLAKKYVGEDKYFGIHKIQSNKATNAIYVNGFLQQMDNEFQDWRITHRNYFNNEGMYGLSWGSKDLHSLGQTFTSGVSSKVAVKFLIKIGKSGSKKFNPLGPVIDFIGITGNPWHVSMVRAAKTGAVLADAISRSEEKNFKLIGHSLGCRVIYYALQALSSKDKSKIGDVILLGGAVGNADIDGWKRAANAINGRIFNCYSSNDLVLSKIYKIANANLSHPIGISPIPKRINGIRNIDCSNFITGAKAHMLWKVKYDNVISEIEGLLK